jgi:predicted regulator of Ras-like GTPase activity (Roadblock/LC7/MglB family)
MHLAIKRLTRVAAVAAAIVASSDSLAMAQPLFATLEEIVSRLTAGFSEVEEVRRKITEAQARRYWVHSS